MRDSLRNQREDIACESQLLVLCFLLRTEEEEERENMRKVGAEKEHESVK